MKKYLNDKSNPIPLGEKIKTAFKIEFDYWKDRADPPNLPFDSFNALVDLIPDEIPNARWEERLSDQGKFSNIGEDVIFQFIFATRYAGREQWYYLKGYFFEKGYTRGVVIQSFRKNETKKKLSLIK